MPGKTDQEIEAGAAQVNRPAAATVGGDLDTGAVLRSVYQKMVEEAVPDEMLDLLGRLD
ncbi:NepR family anti-sigma factor [Sphingomonas bacterium]|uniref:NepR family anti-sigma factor n=1 Tax=Sphingomonas bacterium TaxID=1895847 RepID=UPI0020C70E70|nr:NepR family anti-sigma factor [Sphingomonas bacterium]